MQNDQPKVFSLMNQWHNFAIENIDIVKPSHSSIYFCIIFLINKNFWREKTSAPKDTIMNYSGIKSYKTYKKSFNDLVSWGFIVLIKKSENQYQSNIISVPIIEKYLDNEINLNEINLNKENTKTYLDTKQKDNLNDKTKKVTKTTKKNKTEIPTIEHWQDMVTVWFDFYKSKNDGDSPTFSGQSITSLKGIVEALKKRAVIKKIEWTKEEATKRMKYFLDAAYEDKWLKSNFLLSNLLKQYDSILLNASQKNLIKDKSTPKQSWFNNYNEYLSEMKSLGLTPEEEIR